MLATARGQDDGEVHIDHEDAKSYSQQETFGQDILDAVEIERVLKRMVDDLLSKIRQDRKRVRTITIKVRYPDFTQESHAHSLTEATDIEAPFYAHVRPLLQAAWRKRRPLRLVSVRFSNVEDGPAQLEMFSQDDEKRRKLARVMDQLNQKTKDGVLKRGHQLRTPLSTD
jgi:DNA polymerase IV